MFITSSCSVYRQKIHVGRQLVWESLPAQNTTDFLQEAYRQGGFDYPKFYKMDNLSKLGWLTAEWLLGSATISADFRNLPPQNVCLLLMNASSSLDTDTRYFPTVKKMASPALFVYTLPNIVIGEICIRHGFKGENMFLINDHFDAGLLFQQVKLMMSAPGNEACICGWSECFENDYRSVLYVVENNRAAQSVTFTPENILTLYPQ